MKATILLAEDERDMREVLCDYFTAKSGGELTVISAPDGNTALHLIETQPFDLLLLDIMLPGTDGFALCRAAREQGEAPILFITAREDEQDKLHGYGLGADDYVAKPFGMMALVARIKAVLRRTAEKSAEGKVLQLGELRVDPVRHVVQAAGEPVNLTLKEFELLCLLLDNPGVVFTRDQLLNQIWGYSFDGESRTVDVHVRHLRQKLGDCGKYIETVRGIGYRSGDGNA